MVSFFLCFVWGRKLSDCRFPKKQNFMFTSCTPKDDPIFRSDLDAIGFAPPVMGVREAFGEQGGSGCSATWATGGGAWGGLGPPLEAFYPTVS